MMKRAFIFFVAILLFSNVLVAQTAKVSSGESDPYLMPDKDQAKVSVLISNILEGYHFSKLELNDSLSSVILDAYISTLDNNKLYFYDSDIKSFEQYRFSLDNDIKKGNLVPAYHIYNIFRERFKERSTHVKNLLEKEMDFSVDEYYEADRETASYAKNKKELDEVWRKVIKSQALSLKLTGKSWDDISKTLKTRYTNLDKIFGKYTNEDVFQLYMNAFAESYDPHTSYFSPSSADNFKIDMSQSLEGIGAQLQTENDYTKVSEVIVGGPAYKSNKIKKNDRIVGVAQGEKGEIVDVVGWRLDEVVKLIRGPKGTTVRLQILKAEDGLDALPKEISLIREMIQLEDQVPKKEVLNFNYDNKDFKVGVIKIPVFYFDDKNRSTAKDVRKILSELKNEKVDGVVVDLRYNGGGSLAEAIELSGLFIPSGPVVQVKSSNGAIEVLNDPDPSLVYDGPLAVLVNRFSASASEIFAGAIQDYKRGVVLGEQTFGKGTVQNLLDLDRFIKTDKERLGQVKITLAKFYRVNGSSTQHKGVTPDIEFPSAFSAEDFGESSQKAALPWDQIASTKYKTMDRLSENDIKKLSGKFQGRVQKDPVWKDLTRDLEEAKKGRENTKISLLESKRKKEREELEARKNSQEEKLEGKIEKENAEKSVRKYNSKDLKKEDPYLRETLFLISDLVAIRK